MVDNEQSNLNSSIANNFSVHNIYIKDVSFEAPNTPHIFSLAWEPKVDFDLAINSEKIAEEIWETLLNVTVKVNLKIEEDKRAEHEGKEFETAFIVEVKLAGLFTITGYDKDNTDRLLATAVPALLFPYVRETVSSLVSKGGFPQLILPPMNFDTMYKKHLDDNKAKEQTEKGKAH